MTPLTETETAAAMRACGYPEPHTGGVPERLRDAYGLLGLLLAGKE